MLRPIMQPVRRLAAASKPKELDRLTIAITIFPIASSILENLTTVQILHLMNVNKAIRAYILDSHFSLLREIKIIKDYDYHTNFNPVDELIESPTQRIQVLNGGYDPEDLFYLRFNEFSFDELVLRKILRINPRIHPSLDQPFPMNNRFITKLVLDGTDVSATALFGSYSIGQGAGSLPIRLTPGLISYLATNLEHLSLRHCPNINHSQICIYLLMPPTENTEFKKLKVLKVFNSGENPANGPFHNKPGYGSHGKIAQTAEHIMSINMLRMLFPVKLPISFHDTFSLLYTIPHFVAPNLRTNMMPSLADQLHTQYTAGWFSRANIFLDPMLTLVHPQSGIFVAGPWGGKLGKIHESIALLATCNYLEIELDWHFCMNHNVCRSWRMQQYLNVASINNRTGRVERLGYVNGINAYDSTGPRQQWWSLSRGALPRIPQQLLPPYMPVNTVHLRNTHPRPPHAPSVSGPGEDPIPPQATYYNMDGELVEPLPYDEDRPLQSNTYGLNNAGNHTHVGVGIGQRQARGGQPCSNCGLWEDQLSVMNYPDGSSETNPGRPFLCGELCNICIRFQTCMLCERFYCSNCLNLNPELVTEDPPPINPFAREPPDPKFVIAGCPTHGVFCSTCKDTGEITTCICGKYFCEECLWENTMLEMWECCRICEQWYCERCSRYQGTKGEGLLTCAGAECSKNEGLFQMMNKKQGICSNCIGGRCRKCGSNFCHGCYVNYQDEMKDNHGMEVYGQYTRETHWIQCTKCFEDRLSKCDNAQERASVMKSLGINPYILDRQNRVSTEWLGDRGGLLEEFANFQREELEYYKKCLYGSATMEEIRSVNREIQMVATATREKPVVMYSDRPDQRLAASVSTNIVRHTMERLLWVLEGSSRMASQEHTELVHALHVLRDRLHHDEKRRIDDERKAKEEAALAADPLHKYNRELDLYRYGEEETLRVTESDAELDDAPDDESDDYWAIGTTGVNKGKLKRMSYASTLKSSPDPPPPTTTGTKRGGGGGGSVRGRGGQGSSRQMHSVAQQNAYAAQQQNLNPNFLAPPLPDYGGGNGGGDQNSSDIWNTTQALSSLNVDTNPNAPGRGGFGGRGGAFSFRGGRGGGGFGSGSPSSSTAGGSSSSSAAANNGSAMDTSQ